MTYMQKHNLVVADHLHTPVHGHKLINKMEQNKTKENTHSERQAKERFLFSYALGADLSSFSLLSVVNAKSTWPISHHTTWKFPSKPPTLAETIFQNICMHCSHRAAAWRIHRKKNHFYFSWAFIINNEMNVPTFTYKYICDH